MMSWLLWPSSGRSYSLLMTLCAPFQSWTSLTSSLSFSLSGTWTRLIPTSLALHLPLLLHQHPPNCALRCPSTPRPLFRLPPPPILIPLPQVAPNVTFALVLAILRPSASSRSASCVSTAYPHLPQLPLPPLRLSHPQIPHSLLQLHQQVPFLHPHSSMTLTPPEMQTLVPQLI
jgi:hypothetical protein